MAAASKLAGYSLGQADLLRRAMGKKDKEKMGKERANFIEGCARTNDIGAKKANAIFDLLEKFAGYGFNKSHSAAYGVISYQTAYLKANYPVEFMAGLLSNEINNTEKISVLVGECKRMGISILPPDVNRSGLKFVPETVGHPEHSGAERDEVEGSRDETLKATSAGSFGFAQDDGGKRAIRFGLAAIKHVGEGAMEAAIAERERGGDFKSLPDFCGRLDSRIANRKMLEALIKSGAFDFTGAERAELFSGIDDALSASARTQRDRAAGQVSLFGDEPEHHVAGRKREVAPWSDREKMLFEKELLGFYVTGHPLDAYAVTLAKGNYQTIASLNELSDRASFRVAGSIAQVDKKFTKKEGKPFAVIWLEDLTGSLELVIWNELYIQCSEKLVSGNVVAVRGTLDLRDESLRATAQKLRALMAEGTAETTHAHQSTLDQRSRGAAPVRLRFGRDVSTDELREVREILASAPGQMAVELIFETNENQIVTMDAGAEFKINLTRQLEEKLQRWLSRQEVPTIREPAAA